MTDHHTTHSTNQTPPPKNTPPTPAGGSTAPTIVGNKMTPEISAKGHVLSFFGVLAGLMCFVLVYLGYDYTTTQVSPCESIFRQTSIGLSTKISLLKTEGEISIGREPLVDLTERAQMTALNLKTCCTVLEAGKVDAEQFLQCKAKARSYEYKLDEIIALTSQAAPAGAAAASSSSAAASEGSVGTPGKVDQKTLETKIKAAQDVSKSFNQKVVQVRKDRALETLEFTPPKHVDVSAREQEPNNDTLTTNNVPLDAWISAGITDGKDVDAFSFETPADHRDWIRIEIDNRSTTLEPRIRLFDANKTQLATHHNTTRGANLVHNFVSGPKTRYTVLVSNYYGNTTGGYLVRVTSTKSYDKHEPNNGVLTATKVGANTPIEASIMDGKDDDVFRVEAPSSANWMITSLTNTSTTLRPRIDVFNGQKAHIGNSHNITGGSDLTHAGSIRGGEPIYVKVSDYYRSAVGTYELNIKFETKSEPKK